MKKTDLSINEGLMLLALNDDDGKVRWSASPYLDHALSGAMLVELVESGYLRLDNDKLVVEAKEQLPKSHLLADAYIRLRKKSDKHLIRDALSSILELKDLTQRQMEELVARGILERHAEHFLFIFSAQTYPTVDHRPERILLRRMKEVCIHDSEGDHRLRAVIALAYTAHLLRGPLTAQQLENCLPKLQSFIKENPIIATANDIVRQSEQALYMATTSSFGGVPQM